MKKSCFFVGRVWLIVMGGIAALPLAAQTFVLNGSVRTTDGDPLAARITILRGLPAAGIETHDTAADGTFSIEDLLRGRSSGVGFRRWLRLPRGVSLRRRALSTVAFRSGGVATHSRTRAGQRRQRATGRKRPSPLY